MQKLALGVIAVLLLALSSAVALGLAASSPARAAEPTAAASEAERIRQVFERSFLDGAKAAGKDLGKCEFAMIQEDGPEHAGPAIGVSCTKAPTICAFQVRMNADGSDVEVRVLECAPNPEYVDPDETPETPETSI